MPILKVRKSWEILWDAQPYISYGGPLWPKETLVGNLEIREIFILSS